MRHSRESNHGSPAFRASALTFRLPWHVLIFLILAPYGLLSAFAFFKQRIYIYRLWRPFSIDIFANEENHKVTRFNSRFHCPSTEAIDAFSQNWEGENNWLVPPISNIPQTIEHFSRGNTHARQPLLTCDVTLNPRSCGGRWRSCDFCAPFS